MLTSEVNRYPYVSWNLLYEGRYDKFDRLTFNPNGDGLHGAILRRLRLPGHGRRRWFGTRHQPDRHHHPHHYDCCASAALRALQLHKREAGTFVDLGCGDSADAAVAADFGHRAIGVDLFPPSAHEVRPEDVAPFARADVADSIPFADGSVNYAVSQAMIDLIEPEARANFYSEVYRVLAPGGLFALNGVELANGHGLNRVVERRRCYAVGLEYVGRNDGTFIFRKT